MLCGGTGTLWNVCTYTYRYTFLYVSVCISMCVIFILFNLSHYHYVPDKHKACIALWQMVL